VVDEGTKGIYLVRFQVSGIVNKEINFLVLEKSSNHWILCDRRVFCDERWRSSFLSM